MATEDTFNVDLTVETAASACNNDGTCDSGETTANCPADCPPVSYGGGGGPDIDTIPPSIYNIIAVPELNRVSITWLTNEFARCSLLLGETIDYEFFTVAETDFSIEHSSNFWGLEQNTLYNFKIICSDNKNNEAETLNHIFRTLGLPVIVPPINIQNLQAFPDDKEILLTWENPIDENFDRVIIRRSEDFYPQTPFEGEPVYEGSQEAVLDLELENNKRYYYTAFPIDDEGDDGSGAVVSAIPIEPGIEPEPPKPPVEPPIEPAPPEVEEIELEDFSFFQNGKELEISDGRIQLVNDDPITALIDYDKVPEVLKTIMVTLEQDNKYFSFLLRVDDDKTKYLATLTAPEPGIYPMTLYVLDYKNQALKEIKGELVIEGRAVLPSIKEKDLRKYLLFILLILVAIDLLALNHIRKKRKENKQKILDISAKRYE